VGAPVGFGEVVNATDGASVGGYMHSSLVPQGCPPFH
jgi:hypothetical protein